MRYLIPAIWTAARRHPCLPEHGRQRANSAPALPACCLADPKGYAQRRLTPEQFAVLVEVVERAEVGLQWPHFDPKVRACVHGCVHALACACA